MLQPQSQNPTPHGHRHPLTLFSLLRCSRIPVVCSVSGLWAATWVLCQLLTLFILDTVHPDAAEAFLG